MLDKERFKELFNQQLIKDITSEKIDLLVAKCFGSKASSKFSPPDILFLNVNIVKYGRYT